MGNEILPQLVYSLSEQNRYVPASRNRRVQSTQYRNNFGQDAAVIHVAVHGPCYVRSVTVAPVQEDTQYKHTSKPRTVSLMSNKATACQASAHGMFNALEMNYITALSPVQQKLFCRCVSQSMVIPDLLVALHSSCSRQRFYKKAAAFVLRAVAKHSPELAQAVVDSGALDALVPCLEVKAHCYSHDPVKLK